jgi:hypothetical protein
MLFIIIGFLVLDNQQEILLLGLIIVIPKNVVSMFSGT